MDVSLIPWRLSIDKVSIGIRLAMDDILIPFFFSNDLGLA